MTRPDDWHDDPSLADECPICERFKDDHKRWCRFHPDNCEEWATAMTDVEPDPRTWVTVGLFLSMAAMFVAAMIQACGVER